jgi:hypothetical protein
VSLDTGGRARPVPAVSHRLLLLAAVVAGALFCALFVFSPGFDNGFWRDDFVLLERAEAAREHLPGLWQRWVEPFNRPLAQAAFYLEYRAWGLDAGRYILTNTLLHVVNAALLFWLFQGPLGPQVAAGAALLFALGCGFYGKAVLWAANLPDLLATGFVLATGIAARRAQLARLAPQRAAWMGLAGILFALALASKESGIMALVMVAGLMWPHRRSLGSVVRKIGMLVVIGGIYLTLQLLAGSGISVVLAEPGAWLSLPLRALRLVTFMTLPVLDESPVASAASPLALRIIQLVDQVRPVLGLVLLGLGILWFLRGSGAVRWLLASLAAFLLPFGFIHLPGDWLDIRYAYLPATCFCGLLAYGLRSLWLRSHRMVQALLVVVLLAGIYGDIVLVRRLEAKYDAFGRSEESEARRLELQLKMRPQRPPS